VSNGIGVASGILQLSLKRAYRSAEYASPVAEDIEIALSPEKKRLETIDTISPAATSQP
jgi:hypothetical protein